MADHYGTVEGFTAYTSARGIDVWSFTVFLAGVAVEVSNTTITAALVRASAYIDMRYRTRFWGTKTGGRAQVLAWPRYGAYDAAGTAFDDDETPIEVEYATYEAALRELAAPGSLMPDVITGKIKKRVRVEGAVEVEYAVGSGGAASQMPVIGIIDGILAPLIGAAPSPYFGTAIRA